MELFLILNKDGDALVADGAFDAACHKLVGEAERDGFAVATVGPAIMDRIRKMVANRPGIADVWVGVRGKVLPLGMPAEVLLAMNGCHVDERDVAHDWFGEPV